MRAHQEPLEAETVSQPRREGGRWRPGGGGDDGDRRDRVGENLALIGVLGFAIVSDSLRRLTIQSLRSKPIAAFPGRAVTESSQRPFGQHFSTPGNTCPACQQLCLELAVEAGQECI